MAGYVTQPIEPFYVQPKVFRPHSYMSQEETSDPEPAPARADRSSLWRPGGWNSGSGQILAGLLFALSYMLLARDPAFSSVTLLVLLACALFRMDEYKRRIAQVPLLLSTLMLSGHLFSSVRPLSFPSTATNVKFDAPWLPLFFAVCLFYMPNGQNYTRKILLSFSVLLLSCGLLPGDGYVVIFAGVQYVLFAVIFIGLSIDFSVRPHSTAKIS